MARSLHSKCTIIILLRVRADETLIRAFQCEHSLPANRVTMNTMPTDLMADKARYIFSP